MREAARFHPGHVRKVKDPEEARRGREGRVPDVKGLRDRAIIAIMAYTFARVTAVALAETRATTA
jgi:hypothetical protein